jgi:hypothetical protein
VVRCPGQTVFNLSAARNAGAGVADAPWLCFIDADILVEPSFSASVLPLLRPGCYYRAETTAEGLLGTLICARADFERAGGCDESFQNWGEEDNDLCDALEFGGTRLQTFSAALLRHLPHGDEARTQFYAIRNLSVSMAVNRVYRLFKWDLARLTGNVPDQQMRRQIYQVVLRQVQEVWQAGGDTTVEAQYAVYTIPAKWGLERRLVYHVRVPRTSSPNASAEA